MQKTNEIKMEVIGFTPRQKQLILLALDNHTRCCGTAKEERETKRLIKWIKSGKIS